MGAENDNVIADCFELLGWTCYVKPVSPDHTYTKQEVMAAIEGEDEDSSTQT